MKQLYALLLISIIWVQTVRQNQVYAQLGFNAPVGVKPTVDAEVYVNNGFLIQQKYQVFSDRGLPSTYTSPCTGNALSVTAATGTLFDPGGTSSYPTSCTSLVVIRMPTSLSAVGVKLDFTEFDLENNYDYVFIELPGVTDSLRLTGNSAANKTVYCPGADVYIRFRSDGSVSRQGFRMEWQALLPVANVPETAYPGFGQSLFFNAQTSALSAGRLNHTTARYAGDYSFGWGSNNIVSGKYGVAFGSGNKVRGDYSFAAGDANVLTGNRAVAFGSSNTVSEIYAMGFGATNYCSGFASVGLGINNGAKGNVAIAIGADNGVDGNNGISLGYNNSVDGEKSVAVGSFSSTVLKKGVVYLGDNTSGNGSGSYSPQGVKDGTASTVDNQLTARFAGGFRFITGYNVFNGAITAGVQLLPNATSWSTLSDSTKKERFQRISGPAVLAKIASMKLGTWNYKTQPTIRHYGPMAQEFFALFGRDQLGVIGCDTLINTQDIEGLTLTAVQALVFENKALKAQIKQLDDRLHLLERVLLNRQSPSVTRRTHRLKRSGAIH